MNTQPETNRLKPRGIRFSDSIWNEAKEKAGAIPVAIIIRRLIELWLKGKITLDI